MQPATAPSRPGPSRPARVRHPDARCGLDIASPRQLLAATADLVRTSGRA